MNKIMLVMLLLCAPGAAMAQSGTGDDAAIGQEQTSLEAQGLGISAWISQVLMQVRTLEHQNFKLQTTIAKLKAEAAARDKTSKAAVPVAPPAEPAPAKAGAGPASTDNVVPGKAQ